MAGKYHLQTEALEAQLLLLGLISVPSSRYQHFQAKAKKLIGGRDPDDVDLLALTLAEDIPLWSNDHDFDGTGVPVWTTAHLLKLMDIDNRK